VKTFKKIILDNLKANGHGAIAAKIKSVKYSSYSGGDSVRVLAVNLVKPERELLEAILRDYQYGSFDGMTDCYNYDNRDPKVERQAKYVFLNTEFTPDVIESVKATLRDEYLVTDDKSAHEKRGRWYESAVWADCCELVELPGSN
jgi:hypothetical protein